MRNFYIADCHFGHGNALHFAYRPFADTQQTKGAMAITFVLAKIEEAPELSELRRQVWQTTYRGIYPDDMIDKGF